MDLRRTQLDPLTGLRGIAAYLVLTAHSMASAFQWGDFVAFHHTTEKVAYFGMSLFFILSGFVIHYNYAKLIRTDGYLVGGYQFIIARIARLYPLYIMMFLFTIDSLPSATFHNKQWAMISFLTMTQTWFNLQLMMFSPLWSISSEWFFYFVFLFLMPIFERVKRPILSLFTYVALVCILLPLLLKIEINYIGNGTGWVTYFSPFTRVFEFISGVLASIAHISMKDISRKKSYKNDIIVLICILWCFLVIFFDLFSNTNLLCNFIFAPAIAPLLFFICTYDTFLSRLLNTKPLLFMGEISYSVYLLGFLIITGLGAAFRNPAPTPMAYANSSIKVIVILIFTTFIAYGCFHLFENPARKWIKKLFIFKNIQYYISQLALETTK